VTSWDTWHWHWETAPSLCEYSNHCCGHSWGLYSELHSVRSLLHSSCQTGADLKVNMGEEQKSHAGEQAKVRILRPVHEVSRSTGETQNPKACA